MVYKYYKRFSSMPGILSSNEIKGFSDSTTCRDRLQYAIVQQITSTTSIVAPTVDHPDLKLKFHQGITYRFCESTFDKIFEHFPDCVRHTEYQYVNGGSGSSSLLRGSGRFLAARKNVFLRQTLNTKPGRWWLPIKYLSQGTVQS